VLSRDTREPFIRDSTSLRVDDRDGSGPCTGSTPLDSGWCSYRAGSFAEAAEIFEELKLRPGDADAAVGLGYARLQLGTSHNPDLFFSRFFEKPGKRRREAGLSLPACAAQARRSASSATPIPLARSPYPRVRSRIFWRFAGPTARMPPIFVKGRQHRRGASGAVPDRVPA
jgi:hypothetical protein